MATFSPTVDAELGLRTWLAGMLTGVRVLTETPANLGDVLPVVEVARLGGSARALTVDQPRMDVLAYAVTRDAARDLAHQVHDLIVYRLPGQTFTGGVVLRTSCESGPAWLPYDNTNLRRFGATYSLSLHPRT